MDPHRLIRFAVIGAAGNFLAPIENISENAFRTVMEIDTVSAPWVVRGRLGLTLEGHSWVHITRLKRRCRTFGNSMGRILWSRLRFTIEAHHGKYVFLSSPVVPFDPYMVDRCMCLLPKQASMPLVKH